MPLDEGQDRGLWATLQSEVFDGQPLADRPAADVPAADYSG